MFGHHHAAAPSVLERVIGAATGILHWPLAVWLTIIPIAGGIAIAYVTHRLNLARDRVALEREDQRRRAEDERIATRVRADLTFRLARHREALRAAAGGDPSRLEAEHDAFVRRVAKTDVIDLLGKRYIAFMAVLQREDALLSEIREQPELIARHRTALGAMASEFNAFADAFALAEPSLR